MSVFIKGETKPVLIGVKIIFGVPSEIKPLDVPEGAKIRYRFRNTEFATVFIKDDVGIHKFFIAEDGDRWIPKYEQARNVPPQARRGKRLGVANNRATKGNVERNVGNVEATRPVGSLLGDFKEGGGRGTATNFHAKSKPTLTADADR